jgi:hypothetical protein
MYIIRDTVTKPHGITPDTVLHTAKASTLLQLQRNNRTSLGKKAASPHFCYAPFGTQFPIE